MLDTTVRQRFLDWMAFRPVSRIPLMEIGVWDEALERWQHEGLPKWVATLRHLEDYLQLDRSWNCNWLPINEGIYPPFEPQLLEETETDVIIRDSAGVTCRQKKHNRSIPQFIRFPVETEADYDSLLVRLDGAAPGRYSSDFDEELAFRRTRGEIIGISFQGFFGFPRGLMGLENWCTAFYDQPNLVQRIINDRLAFGKACLARLIATGSLDFVQIWEDMAFKTAPLISPRLVLKYMLPAYEELIAFLRQGGVQLIMMDSDGYVPDLLRIFLQAGADGIHPCEIAAGSDPLELRRQFPGCRLMGGMDKRAIASGPSGVDAELRRIHPLLLEGGYIPSLDHFVPPDVSWDTYIYYVERRRELMFNPGMQI